ncbi:MAG: outer membrane protein assembly factor BamA [Phycisphaerales bacterium]|nr:outer membrane protein assembly factor BamA [Phycisphaerales bacterium]
MGATETIDEQIDALENRPVRAVTLKGILPEDEPLARNQIRVGAGTPMSAAAVREDVHRLARLGRFDRIEARVQPYSDGSVEVVYTFTTAPIIRDVVAVGNREVSDADLAAAVGLLANTPANPFVLDQAKRRIRDLYQQKGYYQADVQIDEKELREQGIVALRIREGDKLRVTDIRFAGNASIPSDELQAKISTKTWGIFSSGTLDDATAQRDVAAVEAWYKDRGFLRAQVDRQIQPSPDGKEAILTFVVSEGPRFTVRSVQALLEDQTAAGSDKPTVVIAPEQIAGLIPLKAGDYYSQEKVRKSVEAVRNAYGQMGYVEATVRSLDRQSVDTSEADIVLIVREGKRSMTGVVTVKGNQFTQSRVIRRQVRVLPDRPLDTTSLKETESRLEGLRIFTQGSVRITPQGEDPQNLGFRDVLVELEEGNTGAIGFGAAASSDGGVVGSISLNQRNFNIADTPDSPGELFAGRAFRGAGQTFSINLQPGSEISTYSVSLSEPYLFDTDYAGSGTVAFRDRKYSQYDESRQGLYASFSHRLGERWVASLALRGENVDISDIDTDAAVDVWAADGEHQITSLALKLRRSALDKTVRPTRGTVVDLTVERVGALGGNYDFTKLGAEGSLYVPVDEDALGLRTVLLLRTAMFFIPENEDDVPVYERFFQGGREFRGFKFRGFGPQSDRNDMPGTLAKTTVGGTWSFFAGAQVEKPLLDEYLSGVAFVDSGTLGFTPGLSDYRASAGVGLRVYIPALGPVPLAFDYAFPFLKQDGDRTSGFSFSLDLPFQ